MRRISLLLLLMTMAGATWAQQAPTREHLAPTGLERSYHEYHYTPVVKVGERVIVSGIPAVVGKTEEEKIRRAFRELQRHLEPAGGSLADVVELNSFHLATDKADFDARMALVLKVHKEFFKDHYPAWTAVGTTALLSPGAPIELRAEAIIGSGRAPHADIPLPAGK